MKEVTSNASATQFSPLPWSINEIRNAIPARLFVRDTSKGLAYLARDLVMTVTLWRAAMYIDPLLKDYTVLRWATWLAYWFFQGLVFTGIWVIGHECGHGAFSDNKLVCDVIGFVTHTFLWTPYFSWRISHHRHHRNHASMERDEVYVPKTRNDLGIPPEGSDAIDWDEYFGDTPIYTLYMLIRQQLLAFPAYLLFNVSGQKNYPRFTNHFDPNSIIFQKSQRNLVLASNAGIMTMIVGVKYACALWGTAQVIKFYGIPWLCVTHWFIMITYLHHTDPELPHYRNNEWSYARGAAATVDRDFLGFLGRFFLHDVAHYHVIHHFFPKMPFYHGPEATEYLKKFIGEHYHYSDKPVFKALWDNYNECQFVDDEGDVLFYRNKKGDLVYPLNPVKSDRNFISSTSAIMPSHARKGNASDSPSWSYDLHSRLRTESSDTDGEQSPPSTQPIVTSDEAQLIKELDLSSRPDEAVYKPNPWTIAKGNAATRKTQVKNNTITRPARKKLITLRPSNAATGTPNAGPPPIKAKAIVPAPSIKDTPAVSAPSTKQTSNIISNNASSHLPQAAHAASHPRYRSKEAMDKKPNTADQRTDCMRLNSQKPFHSMLGEVKQPDDDSGSERGHTNPCFQPRRPLDRQQLFRANQPLSSPLFKPSSMRPRVIQEDRHVMSSPGPTLSASASRTQAPPSLPVVFPRYGNDRSTSRTRIPGPLLETTKHHQQEQEHTTYPERVRELSSKEFHNHKEDDHEIQSTCSSHSIELQSSRKRKDVYALFDKSPDSNWSTLPSTKIQRNKKNTSVRSSGGFKLPLYHRSGVDVPEMKPTNGQKKPRVTIYLPPPPSAPAIKLTNPSDFLNAVVDSEMDAENPTSAESDRSLPTVRQQQQGVYSSRRVVGLPAKGSHSNINPLPPSPPRGNKNDSLVGRSESFLNPGRADPSGSNSPCVNVVDFSVAHLSTRYERSRKGIAKRRRLDTGLIWDLLDLPSCGTVYSDRDFEFELPIVLWPEIVQ
ncbi:hypothetical protein ABKN59_007340 [Abortiporus biennis]